MMIGARTAAWAKNVPENLFKFPTSVVGVPIQSPSTVFTPVLDAWNQSFAWNGYGYGYMSPVVDFSSSHLKTKISSAGGSSAYGLTVFFKLEKNTEYKFHTDLNTDSGAIIVTSLEDAGDGKVKFASARLTSIYGNDAVFTTLNSDSVKYYAFIFVPPVDGSERTYSNMRLEKV